MIHRKLNPLTIEVASRGFILCSVVWVLSAFLPVTDSLGQVPEDSTPVFLGENEIKPPPPPPPGGDEDGDNIDPPPPPEMEDEDDGKDTIDPPPPPSEKDGGGGTPDGDEKYVPPEDDVYPDPNPDSSGLKPYTVNKVTPGGTASVIGNSGHGATSNGVTTNGVTAFSAGGGGGFIVIGANFTGSNINQSGFIPPDTMGAVGPNHVVELLNGRYAAYSKTGTFIEGSSLDAFWIDKCGVVPVRFSFDPRIVYDKDSGCWFACAVDNARGPNNLLVGVSASDDPTGAWTGFSVDSDADNSHWCDFPMMGVDPDAVTITAHMFGLAGQPFDISIWSFPKADLKLGTPTIANMTAFENTGAAQGTSPQPALDFSGTTDGVTEMIGVDFSTGGSLRRTDITGAGAAAATLGSTVGIAKPAATNFPPDARQPGGAIDVDTGDIRFSGNSFRQGDSIWVVHNAVGISGRSALRWYEIDIPTDVVVQTGTIAHPDLDLARGSIAVNAAGCVVIGCTGSSPTVPLSTYVVGGTTTGGITTFGALTQTKLGRGTYQVTFGGARNRWGDYSATVCDPSDPNTFWTFQEFVEGTNTWAIQITEVTFGTPEFDDIAMVTDRFNDTVTTFDPTTNTVLGSVIIPGDPAALFGCAITEDRSLGFVTTFDTQLWVLDLTQGFPTIAAGTNPIPISNQGESCCISLDGQYVIITDGSIAAPISVVNIALRTEVSTLSVATNHNAVACCDDGSILVTSPTDQTLHRLTIDGAGNLTDTGEVLFLPGEPNDVCCAAGGQTGAVVLNNVGRGFSEVITFQVQGLTEVDSRILSGASGMCCAFCCDGTRLYVRAAHLLGSTESVEGWLYFPEDGVIGGNLFTIPVEDAFNNYGVEQIATSHDCTQLYVTEGRSDNVVNVYDAETGDFIEAIDSGSFAGPHGICLAPCPVPPPSLYDPLISGFNDASGINSDPFANSPFQFGASLDGQGGVEPGWAGPWQMTSGDATVITSFPGIEGDGVAFFNQFPAEAQRLFEEPIHERFDADFRFMIPNEITHSVVLRVFDSSLLPDIVNGIAAQVQIGTDFEVNVVDGFCEFADPSCPNIEPTGIFLTPGEFHRIRIRLDPPSDTWELFVDGVRFDAPDPLDFRGNPVDIDAVRYLNEISSVDGGSYLDLVCISTNTNPYMVTDQDDGHVTVFDGDSNTLVGTALVPNAPAGLFGCCISRDGSRGFVNNGQGELWVIDLCGTPRLDFGVNPILLSNNGESSVTTCDGKYVLTCDGNSNLVSVVSIQDRVEIGTLAVGSDCCAIDVCDDGSVLVCSLTDRAVRRLTIDADGTLENTGQVLTLIGEPTEVCCAPGARVGVVVLRGANHAVSFQLNGMIQIDERQLSGVSGVGCTICSDGRALYTRSNDVSGGVVDAWLFDSLDGGIDATPFFSIPVDAAPDLCGVEQLIVNQSCSLLYVAESDPTRVTNVYSAATGLPVTYVFDRVNTSPTGICCVPFCGDPLPSLPVPGTYVVTEYLGNDITIFDGDTNTFSGTVRIPNSDPFGLFGCCVSPDGMIGYVTNGTNKIWLVDLEAGSLVLGQNPITVSTDNIKHCAITCDNRFLVLGGGPGGTLVTVVDVVARTEVSTHEIDTGIGCTEVEVCPDGQTVLVLGTDRILRRLILSPAGTLSDTGDALPFSKIPMNVCCAPGMQSGVIVLTGNDYTEPGEVVSFSLPDLVIVDSRPLSGGVGLSCAICCDGSRVFARSQDFLGSEGFVDAFDLTAATGALGAVPMTIEGVVPAPNAAPGVNQLVVNDDCTLIYVPEGGLDLTTRAYDTATGFVVAEIADSRNSTPFAISCPPCCQPVETPEALFLKDIVDGPDLNGDGVTDLVVTAGNQATFAVKVTIRQPDVPLALVEDTVPAGWELLSISAAHNGDIVTSFPGGFVGGQRETVINWVPTDNDSTLHYTMRPASVQQDGLLGIAPARALDTTGDRRLTLQQKDGNVLVSNSLSILTMSDGNGDGVVDLTGNGDEDGDHLSDWLEAAILGTDPYHPDTDGDGVSDLLDLQPLAAGTP